MKLNEIRTDLALESANLDDKKLPKGVFAKEEIKGEIKITTVEIKTSQASRRLKRRVGKYITLEGDYFYKDEFIKEGERILKTFIPKDGNVLVAGLGNRNITPDALGPLSLSQLLATGHLKEEFKSPLGLSSLRKVYKMETGTMGETGFENIFLLKSVLERGNFSALIVIDSLASRSFLKLGKTLQITDSGISPGSGVDNKRPLISKENLNIPVIAMGVPTVCGCYKLLEENVPSNLILTSKDIDSIIYSWSHIIGKILNYSLQDKIPKEKIDALL